MGLGGGGCRGCEGGIGLGAACLSWGGLSGVMVWGAGRGVGGWGEVWGAG